MWEHGLRIYSVPDAIAKALEIAIGDAPGQTKPLLPEAASSSVDGIQHHISVEDGPDRKLSVCPECEEKTLVNENGCFICKNCCYTKCE
jgi:hypothetical protein